MEELNKKIAEWVGFTHYQVGEFAGGWIEPKHYLELIPDEGTFEIKGDPPNFIESLDACFKYIVPKLRDIKPVTFAWVIQFGNTISDGWYCDLRRVGDSKNVAFAKTPALAFCKAVEKLIGKEH